ncbi:MAG: transcriptional regulator, partial [Candidatus Hecatellales archaeon]
MSEVPLSPVGKEEIHRLESALLVGTLFRPEVLEELRDPTERLTWVDSLAVAAAALAREKAKMPVSRIAEELGRSEATI